MIIKIKLSHQGDILSIIFSTLNAILSIGLVAPNIKVIHKVN